MLLERSRDLVCLTAVGNPLQAEIWQRALQKQRIQSEVRGAYVNAGVGDASSFSAAVWVETADLLRAKAILNEQQGCCDGVAKANDDR